MRILIISHHFWPENFKVNDLVDNFINKGHEVSILTGKPNYPGGKIFKSFKNRPFDYEVYHGAKIYRVPIIPRGKNKIQLFFNYLSFLISLSIFCPYKL